MRKMLHFWFTGCFSLLSLVLSAQSTSLTGMWMGKLFQEEVQPFSAYNLRMELKQEGARVTGISYISLINHSELFAKMRLEGRWDKGVFSFHEVELVDSKHTDGWGWCLKMGDLRLSQRGEYLRLEGRWEGYMDDFPCKPGTLALEKLNPQAKPKPEVVAADEKPEEVKNEPIGNFGAVEGRTITHRKEVPVKNEVFTVYIWDGDKVDGDIVSMQYNGEWLLRKYPISKTKKALRLEIVPGADNQLVLYAENEGQYPPNTAAITFFDGTQERSLNLSSDKSTCGALKFVLGK
jgi:hypothetical protein